MVTAASGYQNRPGLISYILKLEAGKYSRKHYSLINGALFYKGHIVILSVSDWIPKLILEFHFTPAGGHFGAYRTYHCLAANVY